MSNTILKKRAQVLVLILALSVFLTATIAFAATKAIDARSGGVIYVGAGVEFVVPPGALEEDTVISADMVKGQKRVCFYFEPSGTEFNKPAELRIGWWAIYYMDVADLTLYSDDGEEIGYDIKKWGLVYHIDHFSLYYYRRR